MDSMEIGKLITDLRKEKSMTQKELAAKLNVTDKAISKWERGNGYPEITIIPVLANALGITANELLNGRRNSNDATPMDKADEIVSDTIEYIEKTNKYKASNMAFSIISVVFLFGAFTCLLCNYALSKRFDWSLYPLGALAVVWFTITPLLLLRKHKPLWALLGMSISSIVYLFLIEHLCSPKGWVIPLALPITGITFVASLVIIYLFTYTKVSRMYILAIAVFLIGVVVNLSVKIVVDNFLRVSYSNTSAVITALSFAFISILLAILGYTRRKKILDNYNNL